MTKRERDPNRLSAELARWRGEADMTQQELAVAVGATLNYIQKIEGKGGASNRVRPSMDRLVLIVTTLDKARLDRGMSDKSDRIDMNYALSLAGYPPIATPFEWVDVLQRISEIPTNTIHTQEDVNRVAQEIVDALQGQGRQKGQDESRQHSGSSSSNIPGGSETGGKVGKEADEATRPPKHTGSGR